jgi:hypothetical protein
MISAFLPRDHVKELLEGGPAKESISYEVTCWSTGCSMLEA